MDKLLEKENKDILKYIDDILNDDDKYKEFINILKNYKDYAGYSLEIEERTILLLETLQGYSMYKDVIDEKQIIRMFKWVLSSLESIKKTSTLRRNFVQDFFDI